MDAIIRDSLGNKLGKGSLVFWRAAGAVVRILEVEPPANGKRPAVGKLIVAMEVPYEAQQPETFLKDFTACIDPVAQDAIETLVAHAAGGK